MIQQLKNKNYYYMTRYYWWWWHILFMKLLLCSFFMTTLFRQQQQQPNSVQAWTGSHLNTIYPQTNETTTDNNMMLTVQDIFPMDLQEFFEKYYDTKMILMKQSQTNYKPELLLWNISNFESMYQVFVKEHKLSHVSWHPPVNRTSTGQHRKKSQKKRKLDESIAFEQIKEFLFSGSSFVFRYEYVPEKSRPLFNIEKALVRATGIPVSLHMYVSAEGAQVLDPHTDPYDVMAFQISGTKNWTACVPVSELATLKYNIQRVDVTQAQLCMLQELMIGKIEGCNVYSTEDTEDLRCIHFQMTPGDVLYMPKGVVHYAVTLEPSFHLTIGFHRQNMQWFDVLMDVLSYVDPAATYSFIEHFASTAEGVHLHETVPGWLLECFGRHLCEKDKTLAHYSQLKRLYLEHLSSYGRWLWLISTINALYFELDALELPKHRILLNQMANNNSAIRFSFEEASKVRTYFDTTSRRHKPKDKYSLRKFGEPRAASNKPTLCDQTNGWIIECRTSTPDTCVSFVKPPQKASCAHYCASQGLICTAGYDDKGDTCKPSNIDEARSFKNSGLGCDRQMFSMICECSFYPDGSRKPSNQILLTDQHVSTELHTTSDSETKIWHIGSGEKVSNLAPPLSYMSRLRGQPPPHGQPTLCDEIPGWKYECALSNMSICYVMFGPPRKTCDEWCESAGHTCIGGADDNPKVCRVMSVRCQRSTRMSPSCNERLGSHLCICARHDFVVGTGDIGTEHSLDALDSETSYVLDTKSEDPHTLYNRIEGWSHVCNLPGSRFHLSGNDEDSSTQNSYNTCEVQVHADEKKLQDAEVCCATYCDSQGLKNTAAWIADPEKICTPLRTVNVDNLAENCRINDISTAMICRCEIDDKVDWQSIF